MELDEIVGYHLEQACALPCRARAATSDVELAATARRRLAAGGDARARDRTSVPPQVCSSERWRCCPRTGSTSRCELELATRPLRVGTGCRGRHAGRVPDRALRHAGQPSRASSPGSSRPAYVLLDLDPEGATERLDALIAEALPELRAAGDDDALYTAHPREGWSRSPARRATQQSRPGSSPLAMHARLVSRTSSWAGAPWPACTARHPSPRCSRGWTRTSLVRAATTGFALRRGVALAMLGRFEEGRGDPRRDPSRAGGARRRPPARRAHGDRIRAHRAPRRGSGDGGRTRCRRVQAARGGRSTVVPVHRGRMLAGSLYELGRLDEADAWARAGGGGRRSSRICSPSLSGGWHARRSSRGAASGRRRSVSPARRSHSPSPPRT